MVYKYTVLLHPLGARGFFARLLCVLYVVPPSALQHRQQEQMLYTEVVEFVNFRQCFQLLGML